MSLSFELARHVVRAAHLLGLSLAPMALSPEPSLAGVGLAGGLGALLLFAVLLLGSWKLAVELDGVAARVGAGLVWLSVGAAIAGSLYFSGPRAPLARGVPFVAATAWPALAVLGSCAAGRWLGSNWKHKRMFPAIVVLGAGAKLLIDGAPMLGSPNKMWSEALRREPGHEVAFEALSSALLRADKPGEVMKLVNRCLAARPDACACLEVRAVAHDRQGAFGAALADAQRAVERCPERERARAVLAAALAREADPAAKRE